ncbi:glycoside hydrolase family 78 protein [Pedobacter sp. MC2016-15]|uniref:glycoside hydrolase family 78 protein n=1 Tax=Pedobacter sp. MC2016-15 TaxID=2994473 RepID=UPI0022450FDA|nr:glycoside hydrolase family 78 protein [Pedobacter sp. MC2016-15]MCX2480444.1 glycoside hydrolase family 78 protein [Pedobacter sp. MC2016-15]
MIRYLLFTLLINLSAYAQVQVSAPRCETRVNPLGIDMLKPALGWKINSNARGTLQTAYHILVASSAEKLAENTGDLWDSGKTRSAASVNVAYGGSVLHSRNRCYWKVKVWTNKGESEWSAPAFWTMGLLSGADWKGRWIGMDHPAEGDAETQFSRLSARYFRKEFKAAKQLKSATVYIIGLGLYELYINGKKIGDQVLAPGPTDYNQTVMYNTFDVTAQLRNGTNAIGTILGNGRFYTMRQAYKPYKIKTFGYPKMLMNLDLEYTDGTKEVISTDDSWKMTAAGPIRTNNEYDGEEYDATREMPGWAEPGFTARNWQKAQFVQEAAGMPVAQMNENMKVMETIRPLSISLLKPGVYILDMGQNMAGWIRMSVMGKRGQAVRLRFAETLQTSGELFVRNLRDAKSLDIYTLKGQGRESWEPSFVYHGFRYVEISGYPGKPKLSDFEGRVVYDDMQTSGQFSSSNETLNSIYKNAYWGIRGNYKGMPVDCPQRNERQPWLGDRTTGAYGESFLFDNGRLYTKWLDDIQQSQKRDGSIPDVAPAFWRYYSDNVTWPATYFTVADMIWQQYGDLRPVIKHYPSMKKWMHYMEGRYMQDGLLTKDKYGDWCVPPEAKEMIFSKDPQRKTDGLLLATATYYRLLMLMHKFALLQKLDAEAAEFDQLAEKIKTAFNQKFLDQTSLQYSNNSVTANLLPLSFGLVPEQDRPQVFKNLTDKIEIDNKSHISTGVIGTQWLMRGLSSNGRPDLAYRLATNRTYPSWGYMVDNGATTIWELWNGNTADPGMNSQNHVMLLGDLLIWYYENLAGIKAAAPGFKELIFKPDFVEGLSHVDASYQSAYGTVESHWKKVKGSLAWQISLPPNTTARVYIPVKDIDRLVESDKKIKDADGLRFIKMEGENALLELGSGDYNFMLN